MTIDLDQELLDYFNSPQLEIVRTESDGDQNVTLDIRCYAHDIQPQFVTLPESHVDTYLAHLTSIYGPIFNHRIIPND